MFCKRCGYRPLLNTRAAHARGSSGSGFTLVEIMVVLVIVGLLAGLVTVNVRHYLVKGKQDAARVQIAAFRQALDTFYTSFGRYPSNEEGLEILTQKSEKLPEPLLVKIPLDPWGRPYQYNQPGRSEPYDILCFGADGREGGSGADADIAFSDASGSSDAEAKAGP